MHGDRQSAGRHRSLWLGDVRPDGIATSLGRGGQYWMPDGKDW
jgi:hypothetical protein